MLACAYVNQEAHENRPPGLTAAQPTIDVTTILRDHRIPLSQTARTGIVVTGERRVTLGIVEPVAGVISYERALADARGTGRTVVEVVAESFEARRTHYQANAQHDERQHDQDNAELPCFAHANSPFAWFTYSLRKRPVLCF